MAAASVDSWDDARRAVEHHLLTFPMLYGLDAYETAASLGCYLTEKADRPHLHATAFVSRPDSTIALAVYSSGALRRLSVEDALAVVGVCAGSGGDPYGRRAELGLRRWREGRAAVQSRIGARPSRDRASIGCWGCEGLGRWFSQLASRAWD